MHIIKKLVLISFTGLAIGATSVSALQNAPKDLDFEAINASITTALADVVSAYEGLSHLGYALKPEGTNVEQDKYEIDIELGLTESPWSAGAVSARGTFGYMVQQEGESQGTTLSLQTAIATDPLAFVKYVTKHAFHCPVPELVQGVKRVIARRNCADRTALQTVETLDGMQAFVEKRIKNLKKALRRYIRGLNAELRDKPAGTVNKLLKRERKTARKILAALRKATVEDVNDGFNVSVPELSFNELLTIKDVKVTVAPGSIAMAATIKTPLGTLLYDVSKEEVVAILQALEQGQEYAMQLVQIESRIWANLLEKLPAE